MLLSTPLSRAIRTTKDYLEVLHEMGLETVGDLLLYLPRTHEDLSTMHTLGSAPLDAKVTISGTIEKLRLIRTRTGKQLVTGKFTDSEGTVCEVIWFNQPHIKRMLSEGEDVVLTGKLVENGYKLQMQSPTFEKQSGGDLVHSGRLVPIYPQHDKINTKWLRERISELKESIEDIRETLPQETVEEEGFPTRAEAVYAMHFPEDPQQVQRALNRFAFEELYKMQIEALERKKDWQGVRSDRFKIPMNVDHIKEFFASLKFTPY